MGALSLADMRAQEQDAAAVMRWHLCSNHYPPVPEYMVPLALKAVEHARKGEFDIELALPEGVLWRGRTSAPVSGFVESYHLHGFLED